ncbi:uncharacterized protein LOC125316574 [Rhodamnia argentea]|uniref:Uncharacterized protein LOC125316574 n=1 Tax=Rhodamnia argentea TaxID=178133 RepID=A0ABM3HXB5_9MYRT|nr:uncharacterized protein LOC125316574 [Rhodamnia argentea]
MASCQLQKPAEQTCNQKSHEHTFGQKITEMTHRVFKSRSEHKHHQGHQGQEPGHTVVACQTQGSGQTYAHQPDQGIPKAETDSSGNTHVAQTQSHCIGQAQGHHVKQQAAHNADCHGKNGKSLKEKIAEKKNKVKGLFKKKNQERGCEDKKSFSSSRSSSSDSESDNDASRKKN